MLLVDYAETDRIGKWLDQLDADGFRFPKRIAYLRERLASRTT